MGKSLLGGVKFASPVTLGNFSRPCCIAQSSYTSEASTVIVRAPFTLLATGAIVNNQGTGRSIRYRKNGANANNVVTMTDSTAGPYYDTAHTDSYADGDTFDMQFVGTAPAYSVQLFTATIDAPNHKTFYSFFSATWGGSTAAFVIMLNSTQQPSASVSTNYTQAKVRATGSVGNLVVGVPTNSIPSGTTTYQFAKNGSVTLLAVSVAAGATGVFEDSTHSISLADGDLINMAQQLGSASGAIQNWPPTVVFTGDTDTYDLAGLIDTDYVSPGDKFSSVFVSAVGASEADVAIKHNFNVTTSKLRMFVQANSFTSTTSVNMRRNNSDASQVVSIAAGSTGWKEDITNTDTFGASDTFDLRWSGGGGGTINVTEVLLTETPLAGVVRRPDNMDGLGGIFENPLA